MAFRMRDFGYEPSGSGYIHDGEYVSRRQALDEVRGVSIEAYAKLTDADKAELMDERALDLIVPDYMHSLAERLSEENNMSIADLTRLDDWHTIREALEGTKAERNEMLYYLYQHDMGLTDDELQSLYESTT